jgi:polar amino acid transport system substrate-binding protein
MIRLKMLASALATTTAMGVVAVNAHADTATSAAVRSSSVASCRSSVKSQMHTKGRLTVATDNPVYSPWFVNNTPTNGKGYESAVAYAVASELGFPTAKVKWVTEGFDQSYAPGSKSFDFDINEISVTTDRAKVVTFSASYYNTTQSIVALKTNPIASKHSPEQLKTYLYGDQIGTTGLAYIESRIKPTKQPRIYNSLDQAVSALETRQIDAVVVDTPDGQYMANSQLKGGTQVGQFPSTGEHYGLLFQKGNALVTCVNTALSALSHNGTLAKLSKKYLGIYNSIPTIKP